MPSSQLSYYILFSNYLQGLALHDILDGEDIPNRIAPVPRCVHGGELSCGMSLMIEPRWIERVKDSIARHNAEHLNSVSLEGQNNPHRDQYC